MMPTESKKRNFHTNPGVSRVMACYHEKGRVKKRKAARHLGAWASHHSTIFRLPHLRPRPTRSHGWSHGCTHCHQSVAGADSSAASFYGRSW